MVRLQASSAAGSERMQADLATLAALAQVTNWRRQGQAPVLLGPTTLKFRPSDH